MALRGLLVVITHLKPTTPGNEELIEAQVAAENTRELKLIFSEQGHALQV